MKNSSDNWNEALKEKAARLHEQLKDKNFPELMVELQKQMTREFLEMIEGAKAFYQSSYNRGVSPVPSVWQEGSTNLYSYGRNNSGRDILFIPSLINRSYVLDITEKNSFMRYLSSQGFNPYLADWGEPQKNELDFGVEDYVNRIARMIEYISPKQEKPVILAGHCMGGLFAMASLLNNNHNISGLALFSTPWDFHSNDFARIRMPDDFANVAKESFMSLSKVPSEVVQSFFYYLHGDSVNKRLLTVAKNKDDNSETDENKFAMAVDEWVNNGISMTTKIWNETFMNWTHYNRPASNMWEVGGVTINPSSINIPVFCAIGNNDRIVPPSCTAPLIKMLNNVTTAKADTGHIGVVTGKNSVETIWEPFCRWMEQI